MAKAKYVGFSDRLDVVRNFEGTYGDVPKDRARSYPTDSQILYASYDTPPYEGDAFVIFTKDGKLYEVHGAHCSCYGLEGQWEPEETSWQAIAMNKRYRSAAHDGDYLKRLVKRGLKKEQAA